MDLLSKLKTGLYTTLIGSSLLLSNQSVGQNVLDSKFTSEYERLEYYFDKEVNQIIESIERKNHIRFDNIDIRLDTSYLPATTRASYFDEGDSILVNLDHLYFFKQDSLPPKIICGETTFADLIEHEMLHDFTFQIFDDLEEEHLYDSSNNYFGVPRGINYKNRLTKFDVQQKIKSMILEGIADYTYYKIEENQNKKEFLLAEFPKTRKDLKTQFYISSDDDFFDYELGYKIVAPIIDAVGLEEGIRRIYSNPVMKPVELLDVTKYHKRILESEVEQ